MPKGMPKQALTTSWVSRYRLTRFEASLIACVVMLMRLAAIKPISRSRMFSRLSSMRIVNTTTASAVATGFTNGATHSASCPNAVCAVGVTCSGSCGEGSASRSSSAIASAAWAILLSPGSFTARIFAKMLARYSGRFAASEIAWAPAIQPRAPMSEKLIITTMRVEAMRPSFQCSRRRTTGASRNESRIARASGMRTSRARYRTAAATSSPKSEEPLLVKSKQQQRAARHLVLVADGEAWFFLRIREVGVGEELPAVARRSLRQLELHHVLPVVEEDEQRRFLA